jgi:tetratricopeptide (TPR) repeat protein
MPYVEGTTLAKRVQDKPLELRESLQFATQIIDALAEAHSRGITHRDIKPQNIMITPRGQAKLMDFGLAKVGRGTLSVNSQAVTESMLSGQGRIIGTVPYMSPEQACGEPLDARSDIFSFGVVLYEMVSGRPAFASESAAATISAILTRKVPPLTRYSADVPAELERIVDKALAKDKEERYQNAKDLLIDLRRLTQRLEIEAELERSRQSLGEGGAAPAKGGFDATLIDSNRRGAVKDNNKISGQGAVNESRAARNFPHRWLVVAGVLSALVLASVAAFYYLKQTTPLSARDTVLITDFENTTGDAVFDGALKQGLALQLEQSPFLHIFPEERIRETLRYMERSPDERVTPEIAREICQRQGLKAMITGSISSLGSHYVIGLEAVNAQTGEVIARQQVEVASKEQVLGKLGQAAAKFREELGESLPSIQKYNAPIEQATTSSLEALKAFSLGHDQHEKGNDFEAIPILKRAVELDPDFALAYAELSLAYRNTQQMGPAAEYAKKAFQLQHRVSEREKFEISARYYEYATGEMDKLIEVANMWKQTYPDDAIPHNLLALGYHAVGRYEKVVEETGEAIRLNSKFYGAYSNRATALIRLNRFDEARAVIDQAFAQNLDGIYFHYHLYVVAFIKGDLAGMKQQTDWANARPDAAQAFGWQAESSAFSGQMRRAQEFYHQGVELAGPRQAEIGARLAVNNALRNATLGNSRQVREDAAEAIALARNDFSLTRGALALALCGEIAQAQSITAQLSKENPNDTAINVIWLPVIRAAIELHKDNPGGALKLLQAVGPHEAAAFFWPNYIRAQAFLRQKAASEAEAEFQKILDHRGWDPTSPLYPLAYLGSARASALRGDAGASRKAYQNFFALWDGADPDIPIFQEARKEYK